EDQELRRDALRSARGRRLRERGQARRHPDRRASAGRGLILGILLLAAQTACDRSVFYILRGQYDAALHQLDGAKSSGGSPAEIENLRGLALLMKGENAKAIAGFDAALKLQPALAEARFNRALALLRSGDAAKASPDFEKI